MNRIMTLILVTAVLGFTLLASTAEADTRDGYWYPLEQHVIEGEPISGLTYGGGYLWLSRLYQNQIYKIDISESFTVVDSIVPDVGSSSHDREDLAWADDALWLNVQQSRTLFKIDPATGARLDQATFSFESEGLTFDGTHLWASPRNVSPPTVIHQVDPYSLQVVDAFTTGFSYAEGLAWDGNHFWMASDFGDLTIYQFDLDHSGEHILQQFSAPAASGHGAEGLAWDGEFLWYAEFTSNSVWKLGFTTPGDSVLVVNGHAHCIDLSSVAEDNAGKLATMQVVPGFTYEVHIGGQAYFDDYATPMNGVVVCFEDQGVPHIKQFQTGASFSFTPVTPFEESNFSAFVSDLEPEDNVGEYYVVLSDPASSGYQPDSSPTTLVTGTLQLRVSPCPSPRHSALEFYLPSSAETEAIIFDSSGRVVRTLLSGTLDAGHHRVYWSGDNDYGTPLPNATYYLRIEAAGRRETAKLVVCR